MDLNINAGDLRDRVSLLVPSELPDSIGDVGPPTVFATRNAKILTLSGQEFYRGQQFTSEANRQVIMRYLPGVLPSMTVGFKGRSFTILYVEDVEERNIKLVLWVKEVL
jgi:SPP1 family predicted phage head-tail adaptor